MTAEPKRPESSIPETMRGLDVAYVITILAIVAEAGMWLGATMPGLRLLIWTAASVAFGIYCFRAVRLGVQPPSMSSVVSLVLLTALTSGMLHATFGIGPANIVFVPVAFLACVVLPLGWSTSYVVLLLAIDLLIFDWVDSSGYDRLWFRVVSHGAGLLFGATFAHVLTRVSVARTEVDRLNVELTTANLRLQELAERSAEVAKVEERNRLAREIHDGLGHSSTVVNMHLEAARRMLPNDPEHASDAIDQALSVHRAGMEEVRRSVAALRSDQLVPDLLPDAIGALAKEASNGSLDVRFRRRGEPGPLSAQMRLTLYRAAQEALTNVHRHASASAVRVDLEFDEEHALLRVRDDGPGGSESTSNGGFGLLGIRERAHLLGGSLSAGPCVDGGFLFELEVPR